VSFASHKFGKTLQNDLHLSEPSALVKGSAKDRNDIAQKESRALEGPKRDYRHVWVRRRKTAG
jgi:hypothetical protein